MKSKKNFLIVAGLFNTLFLAGVAFWVQRQVAGPQQNPEMRWMAQASEPFLKQLQGEAFDLRKLATALAQTSSLEAKRQLLNSDDSIHIETALELQKDTLLEIRGIQTSFPFPQELLLTPGIGFYTDQKNWYWTYFLPNLSPAQEHHAAIVLRKNRNTAKTLLVDNTISYAFVEQEGSAKTGTARSLVSSLTPLETQDLLTRLDFQKKGVRLETPAAQVVDHVFDITLQGQKFYAVAIDLMTSERLQQKLVLLKVQPDYQSISPSQVQLLLWVLFCLFLLFTVLIYRRSPND